MTLAKQKHPGSKLCLENFLRQINNGTTRQIGIESGNNSTLEPPFTGFHRQPPLFAWTRSTGFPEDELSANLPI